MSKYLRHALGIGLLLSHLVAAAAADWIEGTVHLREGGSRSALPKVFVSARSASANQTLAVVRTGRDGRYRFVDIPAGRLVLTAFRPGYHMHLTAGRAAGEIRLDSSAGCAFSDVDFELIRGAVVTGSVVDALGEPVEGARVSVAPQTETGATRRQSKRDVTDDRGAFRLAALEEGVYRIEGTLRLAGEARRTAVREIRLSAGEELEGVRLTLGSHLSFRVAGTVTGIDFAGAGRDRLSSRSTPEAGSQPGSRAGVQPGVQRGQAEHGQAESLSLLTVRLHPSSRGGGWRVRFSRRSRGAVPGIGCPGPGAEGPEAPGISSRRDRRGGRPHGPGSSPICDRDRRGRGPAFLGANACLA